MEPRIRYAKTSDGVSIPFYTLGEGMPLVWMPSMPWSHIQLDEFHVGDLGEETQGIVGRTPEGPNFTAVAVRMDRLGILVAMVVSPMSPLAVEDEMQEDVRQLAQRQAKKIEAVSQS